MLLGDQKGRTVGRSPFDETYTRLVAAISTAHEIVVAGYSFGDEPINRILRENRRDARIVIITVHEEP